MSSNRRRLLFCGELPPAIVHGVSISNLRIIKDLDALYDISVVEMNSAFEGRWRSARNTLLSLPSLVRVACRGVSFFYTNLPASLVGMVKLLLYIIVVKIFSPRAKVLVHLHRGDFIDFLNSFIARILFFIIRLFVFRIFVLSETSRQELLRYDSSLVRVLYVLRNYVTIPEDKPNGNDLDNICKGFGSNRFLCLSNYIPTKGQDGLVAELGSEDGFSMLFHGYKSDEIYFRKLEMLDKYSMCEFRGGVLDEDKFTIMTNVKALVVTSKNEGMPLVILEAISQGKPVICFDVGYVREYLGQTYPGIVEGGSYADLLRKILWIKNLSYLEYKELCRIGRELFLNNYSRISAKEATLQAFNL